MNVFGILGLESQDRIVRHEPGAYKDQAGSDCVYYVSSVDYDNEIVHALSNSGVPYQIKLAEVTDIVKAEHPIMVCVPSDIWVRHHCDPEWIGRPVRARSVMVRNGKVTGVEVPKWPGQEKGCLTLDARAGGEMLPALTDEDMVRALPASGFNPKRFGDGAASRNRTHRGAKNRIATFFAKALSGKGARAPLDASI